MASPRLLLAVVVVAGCAAGLCGATDHIVGANRGWNPNINYTLWSGNHTFVVGDLICKPLPYHLPFPQLCLLASPAPDMDGAPPHLLLSLGRLIQFVLAAFRYQKGTHNVFEVNQTGYDNCTMDGVAGNWTSGKDFIPLNERRRYFFICGNGF
ncbi:hypothetical protein ACQ4PT_045244 [Festuca glaucescens]